MRKNTAKNYKMVELSLEELAMVVGGSGIECYFECGPDDEPGNDEYFK